MKSKANSFVFPSEVITMHSKTHQTQQDSKRDKAKSPAASSHKAQQRMNNTMTTTLEGSVVKLLGAGANPCHVE